MKLFGHINPPTSVEPYELGEVTLVASPEELRKIARFLDEVATKMESSPDTWEHEHLCDQQSEFSTSPHFVVFNPKRVTGGV